MKDRRKILVVGPVFAEDRFLGRPVDGQGWGAGRGGVQPSCRDFDGGQVFLEAGADDGRPGAVVENDHQQGFGPGGRQ